MDPLPTPDPASAAPERPGLIFGPALRQAREAQGLTLREMTQRTAIRRDYLQALEDAELGGLPEPTFARAYLRTYARELGLDPAPLLADFGRLLRPAPPEAPAAAPDVPPAQDAPTLGPVRAALIAVLLALLLAVGVLLLREPAPGPAVPGNAVSGTEAPLTPAPANPSPANPSPASPNPASPNPGRPVPAPAPQPAPPLQGTVRLTIKSAPDGAVVYLDNRNLGPAPVLSFPVEARRRAELRVEAAGRTPLKQTINLGQSRNLRATLPPAGQREASVLTDLNTGVRTLTPLPPPPPAPAAPDALPAATDSVTVRFVGQSWARVTDGAGRVLYEGVPAVGSVQNYPPGVSVRAGNAGAVQVSVGDGPAQAMGGAGQVVTRQY